MRGVRERKTALLKRRKSERLGHIHLGGTSAACIVPRASAAGEGPRMEAQKEAGLPAGNAASGSHGPEARGGAAFLDWLEALLLPSVALEAQTREAGQRHNWSGAFQRHAAQLVAAFLARV